MRIVIDTNVLVSHLFWLDSGVRAVVDDVLLYCDVLRSGQTYAELVEVVMRKKFDRYLPLKDREQFLSLFYEITKPVVITKRIEICKDPDDNKFFELAVCGKAKLLLTGDKDLLALHPFRGISIVKPEQLLS